MKLTSKQRNRIEEYLTYFNMIGLIEEQIELLKTILDDGKFTSVHKELLNFIEGRYQSLVCGYWEDDNGDFIYGKDVAIMMMNKNKTK